MGRGVARGPRGCRWGGLPSWPTQSWREATAYLYVSDVDALHAEWAASGVEGRLTGPRNTPYDLREFAFVDPDGTLHRVGSPIAPAVSGG
ncbi:hypothetical protein O3597_06890 [Verrucosispora sp. WMMA2044]|uniref:hypothetical protein n=1 Tax=Verrucosispora sp. WMMA2044 TaxID=3016419 RepID=UPI00248CF621|nr:hypothetical protein [Verrucosispora sp. WMMA2044]WBB50182.1 hypothetical protein O3597_06890 [Verrucosispora sp. WMMA2044]